MKLILKTDVDNLGSLGDEVEVKDGYARNFLIPQGMAAKITASNIKQVIHQRALLAKKRASAIEKAKIMGDEIQRVELIFPMKAGENGKLFGSVTQKQIFEALKEKEIELDKKHLRIQAPIKTLGTHVFPLNLHTEVSANLIVKVIAEAQEAGEKSESVESSESGENDEDRNPEEAQNIEKVETDAPEK